VDKVERARYKTLANDAVIAAFGSDGLDSQLAAALERCVDELERLNRCPVCGDSEDPDWPFLTSALEEIGFRLEPL